MPFPLHQDDWWFCQQPDCSAPDRVYGLQAQWLIHMWLQDLKDDRFRIRAFRDLMRSNISLPLDRIDPMLVTRITGMLASGRLHLHKKEIKVGTGSGDQEKQVPFPLSLRQLNDIAPPPPVVEPPTFSPDIDLSAQAATLVAAAAGGTPL